MNHMTVDGSDAPWNEVEKQEEEIEVTVCIAMSKTFRISVNDYDAYRGNYDDPRDIIIDYTNCNLHKAVEDQVVLPNNLAKYTESLFDADLDLKAAGMPKYLKDAISDCKDWNIDDFEIIHEE